MLNRKRLKDLILNRYPHLGSTEAVNHFAKELGISRSSMYLILRHMYPREDIMNKIVILLDIDFNEILFKKENV